MDHQLLHCSALLDLWCFMLHSFGFVWVTPTIVDMLFDWWNWLCKHFWMFGTSFRCVWCMLWRARNGCTFENLESLTSQLRETSIGNLFHWSSVWGFTYRKSIADIWILYSFVHNCVSLFPLYSFGSVCFYKFSLLSIILLLHLE